MQLHSLLSELPPPDLLQQLAAEKAEGVLAVTSADDSFRLRLVDGEVVAAVLWPPRASLRQHLARHEALRPARLASLEAEAVLREVPPAELLGKAVGGAEAVRLLRSYTEEALHRLLATREGVFLFDEAAEASLPPSLCVVFDHQALLAEAAERREAEERLSAWISAPTTPLQLKIDPPRGQASPLRAALAAQLQSGPRSRKQLADALPYDPHAVKLELARMVRDRLIVSPEAASAAKPRRFDGKPPRASLRLRPGRPPELVERLFLTVSEVRLLRVLRSPQSLDSLCRASGFARRDVGPMVEILRRTGMVDAEPPSALRTWGRPLAAAAAAAAVVLTVLAIDPATREGGVSLPASAVEPAPHETPRTTAFGQRPAPPDPSSSPPTSAVDDAASLADESSVFVYATGSPTDEASAAGNRVVEGEEGEDLAAGPMTQGNGTPSAPTQDRVAQTSPPPTAGAGVERPPTPEGVADKAERPRSAARTPTSKPSRSRPPRSPSPPPAPQAETTPAPAAASAEIMPGRLLINAVPYGFVEIDGEDKGATPVQLELPPGRYRLVLKRAGYAAQEREVVVEADAQRIESFTLLPDEGGETNGD